MQNVLHQQLPAQQDGRSVRGLHAAAWNFCFNKEHLFMGSETQNVWLLWLEANSLFTESYVLILLMFSFHSLVRAIKEIVFLADGHNPCQMRPSGNLNFCHPTAERQWLPGRLFPAGMGGEANLAKQSLFRVLLCRWSCSLPFEGAVHTGSKPCAWLRRCS